MKSIIEDFRERISEKEVLLKPTTIDYNFRPEINKIFGKGGTLEK